jgi:hypothetical protein
MRLIGAGDPRREAYRVPSPLKAARPFLVLSLIPLIAGVAGLIPQRDGFVLGALIAGAGALHAAVEYRQLSRLRRLADRQLLGTAAPRSAELVAWRVGELTSERNRRVLAKTLRGVVSELDARRLPGSSPLNRTGVRPYESLVLALADRVGDAGRPVSAQGVLLVEELLTDGWGPLYARDRVDELGASLRRCLTILDDGRGRVADSSPTLAGAHVKLRVTRNGRF